MPNYTEDRVRSDLFIPEIRRIVGPHLLQPSNLEQDCTEATDLIILHAHDMRIAARIRRHGYGDKYPFDITIRARRDSGVKTELSKIVDGWRDWFFYGHADLKDCAIERWWLVDLDAFRAGLIRDLNRFPPDRVKCGNRANGDGTYFKFFDLRSFPDSPPILVASSHNLPKTITTPQLSFSSMGIVSE
jgi:hypothetical protein